MKDYAVVGSGIGGATIAAYLDSKGYDTVLLEKEPYLGGCSSTFKHQGFLYNTGATTLAGYEEEQVVKEMFDSIGFKPDVVATDPAIVTIQEDKVVPRFKDIERFLTSLECHYPHPKNRAFWTLIQDIGNRFYTMHGHYYINKSNIAKVISLCSYLPLLWRFKQYLRQDAMSFIKAFFGDISPEYLRFMEAQVLIVAQAGLKEVNFFTAALSLGYTFNETHYVNGGFSALFKGMTASMKDLRTNHEVLEVESLEDRFILHTNKGRIQTKKLILNSTIYESGELFKDIRVKKYYDKYKHLDNHQSSFMIYMTIKSNASFAHHYQIIQENQFEHTLSNAVFVSFSDKEDNLIAPEGHYSVTVSIHTDSRWWNNPQNYTQKKEVLMAILLDKICVTLKIDKDQIVHQFAATPRTFKHYINRSQLGGNPITMKNFLPKLPGNDTAVKDLYHVGDTVYAAQGWPGVILGVKNLTRLLDV